MQIEIPIYFYSTFQYQSSSLKPNKVKQPSPHQSLLPQRKHFAKSSSLIFLGVSCNFSSHHHVRHDSIKLWTYSHLFTIYSNCQSPKLHMTRFQLISFYCHKLHVFVYRRASEKQFGNSRENLFYLANNIVWECLLLSRVWKGDGWRTWEWHRQVKQLFNEIAIKIHTFKRSFSLLW